MDQNLRELLDTVVKNDYCIGCGICASLNQSPLKMEMDEFGKYKPTLSGKEKNNTKTDINVLSVCPFSNQASNETVIGKSLFAEKSENNFNEYTGYFLKNFAGYVKEGEFRKQGSSGGMGNWIASQLLKNKLVDGIIHVKSGEKSKEQNVLFEYSISENTEELAKGAKSKYYPIEMSQVLQFVKENEGKYALIGIPCYIKAVRLLAAQDEIIKQRIPFYIGLVCGHLKSDFFAKAIAWEMGIEPKNLNSIDFRKKIDGKLASDYGVEAEGKKEGKIITVSSPTRDLYSTNWGHGLFKYNACEFCDDVLAETADVSVGDAWLPEYTKDSMGTNIITVRNPIILELLETNKNQVHIEEISIEKVRQSQDAGFRHRRDGLKYRLYLKDKNNEWRPKKRIKPSDNMDAKRKNIYEQRTFISKESFTAYKLAERGNDFQIFKRHMDPILKEYNKLVNGPFIIRGLRKIKRIADQLVKNV